jgi:hypothetical protein
MTPLSDNLSEVVKVTVVHFNHAGLFGTRTVVEEDCQIFSQPVLKHYNLVE